MKIALVFYGKTRELSKCQDTWMTFIRRYNPDIFFHSWDQDAATVFPAISGLTMAPIDLSRHLNGVDHWISSARNVLPQTYSISQVFRLKNEHEAVTGEMYDWVVKSRFDLKLHDPISIDFNSLDDQRLYVCSNHWPGVGVFDDNLMIGNSGLMSTVYTNLFHYTLDFVRQTKTIPSGEQLLYDEVVNWLKLGDRVVRISELNFDLGRVL